MPLYASRAEQGAMQSGATATGHPRFNSVPDTVSARAWFAGEVAFVEGAAQGDSHG